MMVGSGFTLFQKKLLGFMLIIVLSVIVLLLLRALPLGVLSEIELRTWDWRQRTIAAFLAPDPSIVVVAIDQASLDLEAEEQGNFWVWPRDLYEPVILYARAGGARAIAFDMLFTEQSSYGVEGDEVFAEALRGEPKVVLAGKPRMRARDTQVESVSRFLEQQQRLNAARSISKRYPRSDTVPSYPSALVPTSVILDGEPIVGNVSVEPDRDAVFRHTQPLVRVGGELMLSFPFAVWESANEPQSFLWLEQFFARDSRLRSSTAVGSRLAVRFKGGRTPYKTFPIYNVRQSFVRWQAGEEPFIPLEDFRDRYVLIGATAPGLLDLRANPLSGEAPGVEFNAAVLDNIINRDFIRQVPNLTALLVSLLIIASVSGVTIFTASVSVHAAIFFLGTVLLIVVGFLFAAFGAWFPIAEPLTVVVLSALGANGYQYYLEGRQHRFIKDAFKHYVSPSVIEQIVVDPRALTLGGERRELTIFFSDIQGFTTISEGLEPSQLVQLINRFLTAMTRVILKHGGTVDKYVGDAIVAFWNAPLHQPDHALRGVRAAIECQKVLSGMADSFRADFGVDVRMRIGLHTGLVGVGNFGSEERFNYTMIGDGANLASRLEGANKAFGTYIMVSDATAAVIDKEFLLRRLAAVRVVGKEEVISVFEPQIDTSEARQLFVNEFHKALDTYEIGALEEARSQFSALLPDPVAKKYLSKIERELAERGAGLPWTPVWNLSEK